LGQGVLDVFGGVEILGDVGTHVEAELGLRSEGGLPRFSRCADRTFTTGEGKPEAQAELSSVSPRSSFGR